MDRPALCPRFFPPLVLLLVCGALLWPAFKVHADLPQQAPVSGTTGHHKEMSASREPILQVCIDPPELTQTHGAEHRHLLQAIFKLGLPGIVLDVGANQAGTSYASVLNRVPVIAFEALPHNVELMKSRINKYQLESLMRVVHGAVWEESGLDVQFQNQPDVDFNGQMKTSSDKETGENQNLVTVKTVAIDDIVDEDVQVLKIDVEGCELRALLGARKLLLNHRVPFIPLEYSPNNIKWTSKAHPEALLYFLAGLGYDVYLQTCHRQFRADLRWSCEEVDRDKIIKELMADRPSAYLDRIRILPGEFEEFTKWMHEEVEGGGNAQADLLFVRMSDIRR